MKPVLVLISAMLPSLLGQRALPRYCSPEELALSADGRRLYATCSDSDEVVGIDTATARITGRVRTGRKPRGLILDPVSGRILVANSWSDTITEVDPAAMRVTRDIPVGREPVGLALDARSRRLFVANRIGGDVSVIDLDGARNYPRIPAGPGASYIAARSGSIFVTRVFPTVNGVREAPQNEIVEIDAAGLRIAARYSLPATGAVFHAATTPDGRFGIATALRPKNLIPTAQVEHGGIFGNGLAVFMPGPAGRAASLPIDEIETSLAQPFDVAISSDGSRIFVSVSGADEVAAIDGRRLFAAARRRDNEALANDLSAAAGYLIARIPTGRNPRGLALSRDGRRLYVANRLDDTITAIATARYAVSKTIALGESRNLTPERRGEQHFYSARFAFARQFSCSSCHLDAISDGLSWDLAQDGFGLDIVATKSLEGLAGTAPYKWNGTTPDLETECGQLSERYFFRSQGFRGQELADVVSFLKAIPIRPNRDRLPEGKFSPAQARGRAIFTRTVTKDGRPILPVLRCDTCHFGPLSTSNQLADVGTRRTADRTGTFDTPQLLNLAYRRSFLHDGSAKTLRELTELFNPRDLHGVTSDLSPADVDDLIEYLKTL